jgi:hypothetical protein
MHGVVDPSITTTTEGLWALKWSFAVLMGTALLQVAVVFVSGVYCWRTLFTFDAATAIPLGIAFLFARKRPNKRFTFGYGGKDLAGLLSFRHPLQRNYAGYDIARFLHPQDISICGRLPASGLVFSATKRLRFFAFALDGGSAAQRYCRWSTCPD